MSPPPAQSPSLNRFPAESGNRGHSRSDLCVEARTLHRRQEGPEVELSLTGGVTAKIP